MKFLLILLLCITFVFANNLVVRESDVTISLNNQDKNLKKDDELIIDDGTTVCFKSGNGRVIINERIQLIKSERCYLIPVSKSFNLDEYLSKAKSSLVSILNTNENIKHGTGTKGINYLVDEKDIILKNNNDLIIYSNQFGPCPITINLKNEKGEIIMNVENENNDITFFRISSSNLNTGYSIEVLNGWNEIILNKKVIKAY